MPGGAVKSENCCENRRSCCELRRLLGSDGGLALPIQLVSDGRNLPALEVGRLGRLPVLGGADHGDEHHLENGLLAEGVRDDLQPPALLEEQVLQQIRVSDRGAE